MKNIIVDVCVLGAAVVFASGCSGTKDRLVEQYALALEQYGAGNFSETAVMLKNVNSFFPSLILRAKAEYFSGDLESARSSCVRAIRFRPGAFEARFYLAKMYAETGENEKARRLTEELLTDYPNDFNLLRFAAALAAGRGETAESSALLDRAAELTAGGAMVLLDRARARWIAGRGGEALEDLSRARAMLPWDTPLVRSIENLEYRITEAIQ